MIDIELIHDTVTTTLGVHDQVSLVISVGIIILTGSIFGSLMCVDADGGCFVSPRLAGSSLLLIALAVDQRS